MQRVTLAKRVHLALIMTVMLYLVFVSASLISQDQREIAEKLEEFNELVLRINSAFDIFLNNFLASLIMLIPLLGIFLGVFIVYNTGTLVAALSNQLGINPLLLASIPIFTIYGALEFLGYGFMTAENLMLVYAAIKRELKRELKVALSMIGLAALILAIAAFIEFSIIMTLAEKQNILGK